MSNSKLVVFVCHSLKAPTVGPQVVIGNETFAGSPSWDKRGEGELLQKHLSNPLNPLYPTGHRRVVDLNPMGKLWWIH